MILAKGVDKKYAFDNLRASNYSSYACKYSALWFWGILLKKYFKF